MYGYRQKTSPGVAIGVAKTNKINELAVRQDKTSPEIAAIFPTTSLRKAAVFTTSPDLAALLPKVGSEITACFPNSSPSSSHRNAANQSPPLKRVHLCHLRVAAKVRTERCRTQLAKLVNRVWQRPQKRLRTRTCKGS